MSSGKVEAFLEHYFKADCSKLPTEAEMILEEKKRVKMAAKEKGISLDDTILQGIVFLSVAKRILFGLFVLSGGDFSPKTYNDILKEKANEFCSFVLEKGGYVGTYKRRYDPKVVAEAERLFGLYANLAN